MRISYTLHFRHFCLQDVTTTMECQNKKDGSGGSIMNYKETKKKPESGLTSYTVLLNVQGFVDTKGFSQVTFSL